jgi:hypothetical protein
MPVTLHNGMNHTVVSQTVCPLAIQLSSLWAKELTLESRHSGRRRVGPAQVTTTYIGCIGRARM